MHATHPHFLSSESWKELRNLALDIYENKCMCCGAESKRLNADHILPRKIAPELALDIRNIQLLCPSCNKGKGNMDVVDFRSEKQKQIAREHSLTQLKRETA